MRDKGETMQETTFKDWFKKKFDESQMTAKEFAEVTRLSKPLVYFYMTGKRQPTESSMKRIAKVFNTDPAEVESFIHRVGRPSKPRE